MNFNKKSLTISLLIAILVMFLSLSTSILNPLFSSFVLLFIYYFLLYWLLDFDMEPLGFLNILLLSSIYIQSLCLFVFTIFKVYDLPFIFTIGFGLVLFLLTQVINRIANIVNVSSIKKIPLFQVSQSFIYIFSVLSILVVFITLEILEVSYFYISIYILFLYLFISIGNLSLFERKFKPLISYIAATSLLICLYSFILSFLDISVVLRAVSIALICFVFITRYFMNDKRRGFISDNIQTMFVAVFLLVVVLK